jgi:hypothetical protein
LGYNRPSRQLRKTKSSRSWLQVSLRFLALF